MSNDAKFELDFEVSADGVDKAVATLTSLGQAAEQSKKALANLTKEARAANAELDKLSKASGGDQTPSVGSSGGSTSSSFSFGFTGDADGIKEATAAQAELTSGVTNTTAALEKNAGAAKEASGGLKEVTKTSGSTERSLASTRYALYDVAAMYTQVGVAGVAAAGAVYGTGAAFEAAFVGVERTADLPAEKLQHLRNELVQLSTEIPVAFTDLSEIATLGGQMDIAGDKLDDFAANVAMFSATTDASIDQTATSFGRIIQLSGEGQDKFGNLASAIYDVGIHTVATESQILTMTQQITAATTMAGFATDSIVGLAGALASLGVQPERARGSIERSFNEISKNVDLGNEKLMSMARIAGTSADQFATAWKDAPEQAFMALMRGLNEASNAGENFSMMLDEIGIKNVRELDMYRRLASNVDLLAFSMDTASDAWIDGERHVDAYGLVADTVMAKLKQLGNTILAIFDSMNNSAFAKAILDVLQSMASAILKITNLPFIGWLGSVGAGLAGVVGVIALAKAGLLTLQAGLLAVQYAQKALNQESVRQMATLKGVKHTLGEMGFSYTGIIAKIKAKTVALREERDAQIQANMAAKGMTGEASLLMRGLVGAEQGVKSLGAGLLSLTKTVGPLALVSGGVWLAGKAIDAYNESTATGSERAERFGLTWGNVAEAIKADLATFYETENSLLAVGDAGEVAAQGPQSLKESLEGLGDSHLTLALHTIQSAEAQERFNNAIGEQGREAIAEEIANNERLQEIYSKNREELEALGFDFQLYIEQLKNADFEGVAAQLETAKNKLSEMRNSALETAEIIGGPMVTAHAQVDYAMRDFMATSNELGPSLKDLEAASESLEEEIWGTVEAAEYAAVVYGDFGDSAEGAAGDLYTLEGALQSMNDNFFDAINAEAAFEDSLYRLGEALAINGTTMDLTTEAGRANWAAFSSAATAAVKTAGNNFTAAVHNIGVVVAAFGVGGSEVMGLTNQMLSAAGVPAEVIASALASFKSQAPAAATEAGRLAGQMKSLGKAGSGAGRGAKKAGSGAKKAGQGAKEAAKEIRTLTDYVKDLGSVLKSAFDFRWGLDVATDSVADQFYKMSEALQDAKDRLVDTRQALRDLQADMNSMKSSQATLEYQLTVAQDYGDTLREQEIMAELSKLREDMAKNAEDQARAERDLAKAEEEVARNLTGNTQASRDQRAEVLSLVQAYQDQVKALADTGLNQTQLERETKKLEAAFYSQMEQLGYSRAQADRYTASFKDMTQIIREIPRDITMDANLSPAERAIAEFMAKKREVNVPVKATGGGGGAGGGVASGVDKVVDDTDNYLKKRPAFIKTAVPPPANSQMQGARDHAQQRFEQMPDPAMDTWLNTPTAKLIEEAWREAQLGLDNKPKPYMKSEVKKPVDSQMASSVDAAKRYMSSKVASMKSSVNNVPQSTVNTVASNAQSKLNQKNLSLGVKLKITNPSIAVKGGPGGSSTMTAYAYSSGGYTGRGGKYDPAGIVHRGEYVFPKDQVDQSTGLPTMTALAEMMQGHRPTGGGGGVATFPNTMIVELSPVDRQLIQNSNGSVVVAIDGKAVAQAVNSSNANSSMRGA